MWYIKLTNVLRFNNRLKTKKMLVISQKWYHKNKKNLHLSKNYGVVTQKTHNSFNNATVHMAHTASFTSASTYFYRQQWENFNASYLGSYFLTFNCSPGSITIFKILGISLRMFLQYTNSFNRSNLKSIQKKFDLLSKIFWHAGEDWATELYKDGKNLKKYSFLKFN